MFSRLSVRIDAYQKKELERRAKISCTSISRYIRTIINIHFKKDFVNRIAVFEALILSVVEISHSLSNITSNLNQIAYKLNSYQNVEIDYIEHTQEELLKTLKKVQTKHSKIERALIKIQKKEAII